MNVTPHIAQNISGRSSGIDGRTTRHGRLCRQPAHPQAHRGGIRLDQEIKTIAGQEETSFLWP